LFFSDIKWLLLPDPLPFWRVISFHHKHDATTPSSVRTSENSPSTHSGE
jgi:hypothetical protein